LQRVEKSEQRIQKKKGGKKGVRGCEGKVKEMGEKG
jgi:hypothetical protein